jgi:drug/metabolite transporter (DMT)-like permease
MRRAPQRRGGRGPKLNTTTARVAHPDRDALVGLAFALVAAIGFSAKSILVKLAYREGVDAVTLLALRMAFALPFFAATALWTRLRHAGAVPGRDWALIVALGLAGYYLSSYLDFLGLQYISAGLERLILFLYPTLTVLLTAALYRRAIGPRVRAAMVLSYAGILLVFLHDSGSAQPNVVLGAALVFGGTLAYSVYLVGAGHAIGRLGALRFTAYASIVASAASLLQFAATRAPAALHVSARAFALAFAMAILSTVLPVFLLSLAIRRIGPARASLVGSVGPVSTILLAWLFLQEGISLLQIGGSALVLAGVLLISRTPAEA